MKAHDVLADFELADSLYEALAGLARESGAAYAVSSGAYVCSGEFDVFEDVVEFRVSNFAIRFGVRHGEYSVGMPIAGTVKNNTGRAGCPEAGEALAPVVSAGGAEAAVSRGPGREAFQLLPSKASGGSWRADCGDCH